MKFLGQFNFCIASTQLISGVNGVHAISEVLVLVKIKSGHHTLHVPFNTLCSDYDLISRVVLVKQVNRVCAISEVVTLYMEGEGTHYKYTHTSMGCTHVQTKNNHFLI